MLDLEVSTHGVAENVENLLDTPPLVHPVHFPGSGFQM